MNSKFLALCYHYIRKDSNDPFPRLLGTKISDFNEHMSMLKKEYNVISLDDVSAFYSLKSDFTDVIIKDKNVELFKTGVDISSPSGSFRISYNANKILALKPIRGDQGSIEHLELITIKNREQERLNCRLDVDQKKNGRII